MISSTDDKYDVDRGRPDAGPARHESQVRPVGGQPTDQRASEAPTEHAAACRAEERRAQILAQAYKFFSEYGLTAQTRALAEACGVSQRLLYSFFPSKAALLEEVYRSEIAGSFKAIWFAELNDRSIPVEQRLNALLPRVLRHGDDSGAGCGCSSTRR